MNIPSMKDLVQITDKAWTDIFLKYNPFSSFKHPQQKGILQPSHELLETMVI